MLKYWTTDSEDNDNISYLGEAVWIREARMAHDYGKSKIFLDEIEWNKLD